MNKRGSNAVGVRRYNERLVLSTVRRLNGASKTDISKITGLSPQAAVRIVESLADDGHLIKAGKRMGGMGQPSIIYRIDGDSGFTIGAEIGRDRLICAMLDFDGRVIICEDASTPFPNPRSAIAHIQDFAAKHLPKLPARQRENFLGFGIAMPWFIGEWRQEANISASQAAAWAAPGLEELFLEELNAPVFFDNDGNAGALAEFMSGSGADLTDFLYIHIGNFIGGGLILNGEVRRGRNGNAGAIASMPIPRLIGSDFLLHAASLYQIELDATHSPGAGESWIKQCADAISFVIISVNSLLDLDAIIIGGDLNSKDMMLIQREASLSINAKAPPDFFFPDIKIGHNGKNAPSIGAALLPLYSTYAPNLKSLLNENSTIPTLSSPN